MTRAERKEQRRREYIDPGTKVMALHRAKEEVKRQLHAEGRRVAELTAKEIMLRAEAYCDDHREELEASARAWLEGRYPPPVS
jgi:hypothetical protein